MLLVHPASNERSIPVDNSLGHGSLEVTTPSVETTSTNVVCTPGGDINPGLIHNLTRDLALGAGVILVLVSVIYQTLIYLSISVDR